MTLPCGEEFSFASGPTAVVARARGQVFFGSSLLGEQRPDTSVLLVNSPDGLAQGVDQSSGFRNSRGVRLRICRRVSRGSLGLYPLFPLRTKLNGIETLLVHQDLSGNGGLDELIAELKREGVQLYGGPRASTLLKIAEAKSFHLDYSSLACTIGIVDDVFAAIDHIHHHGRGTHIGARWSTGCYKGRDRLFTLSDNRLEDMKDQLRKRMFMKRKVNKFKFTLLD
ncbi:hypothetical protein TSUD_374510 [Trifolium subterraneum]|uniref:Uncharacterized protein n=1 Tax=Trifolium subterraneum TaxID=3900 RepID=A0A2Z6PI65_TRISU|nr:hypothetical protein TSUD_374510 [Trifolium subterraneum]